MASDISIFVNIGDTGLSYEVTAPKVEVKLSAENQPVDVAVQDIYNGLVDAVTRLATPGEGAEHG